MSVFYRLIDSIRVLTKQVTDGQVIILLGQRGRGKSETIKSLCKNISGNKYVISLDENLNPIPTNPDDKKDYKKLPRCKVIEDEKDIIWEPGLYIFEDFPMITKKASIDLYNNIKTARHNGLNFLIVAHDAQILRKIIIPQSNQILIYQDAVITAQQLNRKVGGLKEGHSIIRATNNLQKFHYLFISFDYKKWYFKPINSRDTKLLRQAVRGNLDSSKLTDIYYPKKKVGKTGMKKDTEKELIEELIKLEFTNNEIMSCVNLDHPGYIWKIKHYLKQEFTNMYGNRNLPKYLEDGRKK